jgi:hypothetical protein
MACHVRITKLKRILYLSLQNAITEFLSLQQSLLSVLSFESSPGSKEGGSDQQMTPEVLIKVFSVKKTLEYHK